jgi:hypothetical protein
VARFFQLLIARGREIDPQIYELKVVCNNNDTAIKIQFQIPME